MGLFRRRSSTNNGVDPKQAAGSIKTDMVNMPISGLLETNKANNNGAHKYGPHNWTKSDSLIMTSYINAIKRHLTLLEAGEDVAHDSGIMHLGHIASTCMILIDAIKHGNVTDDRYKVNPEVLEMIKKDLGDV